MMNQIWVLTWTLLLVNVLEVCVSAPVSLNSMQYILKKKNQKLPHKREKNYLYLHSSLSSSVTSLADWNLVPLPCTVRCKLFLYSHCLWFPSLLVSFILHLRHKHAHITHAHMVHMRVHLTSYEPPLCLFWRLLWVFSLPFLPLIPWHLVHPVGGSWDLLFQSKCPLMHTDPQAICFLLLNLIPKRQVSVSRCENICLQHKGQREKLKMCLTYLNLMFYSGSSPLLPLQRRGPLCPPKTCRGRKGGPGPSSGQLKGYVYLFSEYVINGGVRGRKFVHLNMYWKSNKIEKKRVIITQIKLPEDKRMINNIYKQYLHSVFWVFSAYFVLSESVCMAKTVLQLFAHPIIQDDPEQNHSCLCS